MYVYVWWMQPEKQRRSDGSGDIQSSPRRISGVYGTVANETTLGRMIKTKDWKGRKERIKLDSGDNVRIRPSMSKERQHNPE